MISTWGKAGTADKARLSAASKEHGFPTRKGNDFWGDTEERELRPISLVFSFPWG